MVAVASCHDPPEWMMMEKSLCTRPEQIPAQRCDIRAISLSIVSRYPLCSVPQLLACQCPGTNDASSFNDCGWLESARRWCEWVGSYLQAVGQVFTSATSCLPTCVVVNDNDFLQVMMMSSPSIWRINRHSNAIESEPQVKSQIVT